MVKQHDSNKETNKEPKKGIVMKCEDCGEPMGTNHYMCMKCATHHMMN